MKTAEEILKETLNLKGEITEKHYWMTVTVGNCLKAINKALDEAYNKPIKLEPTTDESMLNVGDKVICLAKNGNNKNLTVGKKYTVIQNNLRDRPKIKNDIGKNYSLRLERDEWSKAY